MQYSSSRHLASVVPILAIIFGMRQNEHRTKKTTMQIYKWWNLGIICTLYTNARKTQIAKRCSCSKNLNWVVIFELWFLLLYRSNPFILLFHHRHFTLSHVQYQYNSNHSFAYKMTHSNKNYTHMRCDAL